MLCVEEPMRHVKTFKAHRLKLHLFSTRFNGYIKCILLIFDMDELKEKYGAQLTVMFHPINFSSISSFPNYCNGLGNAYNWLLTFHGNYGDSAIWHVKSFLNWLLTSIFFLKTIWWKCLLVLFGVRPVVGSIRAFLINV